ncbi:MAG: neutral zinc metallopeptidase [Gaiellaceae bacterium]
MRKRLNRRRAALLVGLAAAALALAGCGGNESSQEQAFESVTPAQQATGQQAQNGPAADDPNVMRPNATPNATGQSALDLLPAVPEAFPSPRPNVVGSGDVGVDVFMSRMAKDASNVWEQAFRESGLRYVPAKVAVIKPGQRVRTLCGNQIVTSSFAGGPFYCSADSTIFLPVVLMDKLIYQKYGDFSVAYAVAHEWAHRIQDLLGLLNARNQGQLLTIQIETQADCFAGIWARTAYRRGLLEKGDIQEAIKVADLIGDADGTPDTDPRAHGRSGLRSAWFLTGYQSGKAGDCKTYTG